MTSDKCVQAITEFLAFTGSYNPIHSMLQKGAKHSYNMQGRWRKRERST